MRINCEACGVLFECDPGPSGRKVACPFCRTSFFAFPLEQAITTEKPPLPSAREGIVNSSPVAVDSSSPARLGQLFALEEGIDLNERFKEKVSDEGEATQQLRKWQSEIPKVESAYQPSGELPATAVMLLLLGSMVGCVTSLFAGALVGSVGLVVAVVFHSALESSSFGLILWRFVHFPLLVLTIIGAYFVTGWVSAWWITRLGEWGKNRNTRAAVLFSVAASIIPVLFAWGCYYKYIGSEPRLEKRAIRVRLLDGYSDPISVVSTVFGLVIAPVVAGLFAAHRVRSAKFCGNCKSFMGVTGPKLLSLGCLRALVRALRKQRIDVARSLLHGPSALDGEAWLYSCHYCSRGYIEVTATYLAVWERMPTGGPYSYEKKKERKATWLAVS